MSTPNLDEMPTQLAHQQAFNIRSDAFDQRQYLISKDASFFERRQEISEPSRMSEVFGPTWLFGVGYSPPDKVGIYRKGQRIAVSGSNAFFLPPFSIIEWDLQPSTLVWGGFCSVMPLPAEAPTEAVTWPWPSTQLPDSIEDLFSFLKNWKSTEYKVIEKIEKSSPLACRVKCYLDENYLQDIKIAGLAKELDVSRVVMGRVFKECYGLSPVTYRNRLRLAHSLKLLTVGETVTSAAYNSGYSHLSRFNRQFRDCMMTTPAEFCLGKKKSTNSISNQVSNQEPPPRNRHDADL